MQINTDLIYPIGSIYLSVNTTNPSKYFGGTWEQITSDAYLKIVSSGAGSLGGTSADHKIPKESMPVHNHSISHVMGYYNNGGSARAVPKVSWSQVNDGQTPVANNVTNNTGGGQAYYPYYYGVYVWRRTA